MKSRSPVVFIAPCFALALIQLVGALTSPVLGALCGLAVGGLALLLERWLEMRLNSWPLLVLIASGSSLVGILLPFAASPSHPWLLFLAPVLAAGTAALAAFQHRQSAPLCEICKRRMGDSSFTCPRCGMLVCDRGCWVFEGCRCRRCEEHRVPILSTDPRWWEAQLGPRFRQGKCQLCQTAAEKTDLRACRRCGRPYCRKCWDSANGQCSHCAWTIRDLPKRLEAFVSRSDETRSSRTRTGYR
ncbi:MAG: hypothetical protein ABSH50_31370 [Bryobacteraceae bacterium]|jgi:hypothetical protein